MGLSNFPGSSEGVLPVLVVNTVLSVALIKSLVRSLFHVITGSNAPQSTIVDIPTPNGLCDVIINRRVTVARYKSIKGRRARVANMCCVCLCGFEDEEEVSELSCKHFYHKGCLEKWFGNDHTTCPLCRSVR